MGFFKSLFGGNDETPEEKKQRETERDVDVLRTDGQRALRMGQAEYAVKCFEKALQLRDDLETRDYLSQALIGAYRLDEAMQQLRVLHEAQPDNVHILSLMAKVAFMMDDYGKMTELCEQAMLLDKDNAELVYLYGRAALGQHDKVNAVAMFTKTIMLDEHFADAYLKRGEVLLEMGDVEGAAEDADWLMEKVVDVDDVFLFKARVLEAQNNDAAVIDVLSQAIERNPFLTDAYRLRGAARLRMGDKDGAAADAAKVLELHPEEMEDITGEYNG